MNKLGKITIMFCFCKSVLQFQTGAVLVFATKRKNNVDPPPESSEEGELRSAVFCQVTGVHLMWQLFMNDLLREQGKQRSRGIR